MTALRLAEAGVRVTLIESDFPGGGSTGAAMGHIVAMDDSPEQLALCAPFARSLGRACRGPAGARRIDRCGTLWLAADDDELAAAARVEMLTPIIVVAAEVVDARALYALEPHLRPGLAGGLFVPGDAVCYPPAIARALTERAVGSGTHVRANG